MRLAIRFLGFAAIFFYALCWFVSYPSKALWYVGIGLPWISLIVSIPVYLLAKVNKKDEGVVWGAVYVFLTTVFIVVASIITGTIYTQLPHLAACTCFIAEVTINKAIKEERP